MKQIVFGPKSSRTGGRTKPTGPDGVPAVGRCGAFNVNISCFPVKFLGLRNRWRDGGYVTRLNSTPAIQAGGGTTMTVGRNLIATKVEKIVEKMRNKSETKKIVKKREENKIKIEIKKLREPLRISQTIER